MYETRKTSEFWRCRFLEVMIEYRFCLLDVFEFFDTPQFTTLFLKHILNEYHLTDDTVSRRDKTNVFSDYLHWILRIIRPTDFMVLHERVLRQHTVNSNKFSCLV